MCERCEKAWGQTDYERGYKAGRWTATLDVLLRLFGCNVLEDANPSDQWQQGFLDGYLSRKEGN